MKTYFSILFFVFISQYLHAAMPEIKMSQGRMWVQKYDLNGVPVFNDEDRDQIIASSIDIGTGSVTASDFVLVSVSTHLLNIVEEMNNAGEIYGRSDAIKIIKERSSRNYNLGKLIDTDSALARCDILKINGYDVS